MAVVSMATRTLFLPRPATKSMASATSKALSISFLANTPSLGLTAVISVSLLAAAPLPPMAAPPPVTFPTM